MKLQLRMVEDARDGVRRDLIEAQRKVTPDFFRKSSLVTLSLNYSNQYRLADVCLLNHKSLSIDISIEIRLLA